MKRVLESGSGELEEKEKKKKGEKTSRSSSDGTVAAASERLSSENVRGILEFLSTGKDWIRFRQVCKHWCEVSDEVGLGPFRVTLAKPYFSSSAKMQAFCDRHGSQLRHLDLTHCLTRKSKVMDLIVEQCPALRHFSAVALMGKHAEALLRFPDLESFVILDASTMSLRPTLDVPRMKRLHLWQAAPLRTKEMRQLVGGELQELCISDAPHVGDCVLRRIKEKLPPLEDLTLRNVATLSTRGLSNALSVVAKTLRTLDLSGSVMSGEFPSIHLPELENLILDESKTSCREGLPFVLSGSTKLRLVSLVRCVNVDDQAFTDCMNREECLQKLRVARLSGTRVTSTTVTYLQRLPQIKIISVSSCRELPRSLRLNIERQNTRFDLSLHAPGLRFP